jgi:diaminohydroxyphosphoribosylaminopyrimidine deaminase/5-amino-6-(5-phosphoribosylamino)uracil reductase
MKNHEYYMRQVLKLAKKGMGLTNPNPLVGAIIVKEGKIIAKGYHKAFGLAHAEVNAINNAKESLEGSTLYVNLEPCSHYGKTPPCAKAIIEAGVKNVVIAMIDPNPLVKWQGVKMLKNAGVDITLGVLENEAKKVNEIYIKYITQKEPFVIMKSAMTLDGKIATFSGNSKWISCEASRNYAHKLRNRVSAIMLGINTVLTDNPRLTTRLSKKDSKDPIKVIIDSKGRLPIDSNVINSSSNAKVILATTNMLNPEKEKQLSNKGVTIIKTDYNNNGVNLISLMSELYNLNIDSVLIEGGGNINASALSAGIVDKAIMFIAPKIVGGKSAKTPVEGEGVEFLDDAIRLNDISISQIGSDILVEGYVIKE